MATPDALKGLVNPRTGKPFGKEIKIGLATRHLQTARMRRDQLLGELRQLQATANGGKSFTLGDALDWRDDMLEARERDPSGREAEAMGMALTDLLISQEQRGARGQPLQRFARVALADGFPLSTARDQYVRERSPGNAFNFKPLKPSIVRELDIALGHLQSFLRDTEGTACMEDVTPELAREFRQEYLPSITSKQTKAPMSDPLMPAFTTAREEMISRSCASMMKAPQMTSPFQQVNSKPSEQ